MSILVVGTVAFDSIETPFGSAERVLGGSASYFAVAASFFSPVKIVGVIGQDFPQEYLTIFSGRGVDLEGLRREKGETFHWRGRYHEDLNVRDTVELHLNVLSGFVPHLPESYRDAEYVFLGNIDPDMQMEVLRQLRRMRLVACDTMDHWILNSGVALRKVLRKIETLVINDSEARLLSGEHNIVRAARAILKMGPKVVLIKRGEYGVLQFSDSSIFGTPAYPLEEVFDPTGAGDSFAGGFMGYLARSGDHSERGLRRSIVYGSVVASFTVEDFGLKRLTRLSLGEVEERYQRFLALTDFHT
ncbi:MAG: sugar kinase [Deltaproteobacteria bacterium RIFCSPLOWO2_02_56_12]|nr:MAG: sugar kinase [Deltaproteobacteria bacterium RIFCSPLOWO2_02_56_12]OGQ95621.1 MAG: sugar kinase [Deltaproteobacteria bacterium RIFOXYA2_FULL_55_11]